MSSRWHMNPITSVLSMYQTPPGVVRGVSWVRVSTISHSLLARCCLWQKTQLERELELATTTTSSANDERGRQPGQGRAAAVVKNGITPASKGAGNRWGYTAQIPGDQFSYSPHKGALATAAYRKQNKGAGFRVCRKAARGTPVQVPPPPPPSGLGLAVGGPSLVHAFMPPTLRGTYPPALAGPAPPLCWLGTPDSKPGIGYGPFEGRGERAASSREWLAAPPPPLIPLLQQEVTELHALSPPDRGARQRKRHSLWSKGGSTPPTPPNRPRRAWLWALLGPTSQDATSKCVLAFLSFLLKKEDKQP
jgi:hypothetical protein